jgi:hypothetical protein
MDKTTKEQVNTSFESPLWEELSDEAAAACVGGAPGEVRQYLKGIVTRLLQVIWWGRQT